MSNWYVCSEGGDVVGPVTSDLLEAGITSGKVPLSASVCREGEKAWLPLTTVGQFATVVRQASTQPAQASPPMTEASTVSSWHLRYDGVDPVGPMPEPELVRSIGAGQVHATAWVRRVGEQTWVRIRDVPAFSGGWPQQQQPAGHPTGPAPNDPVSALDVVLLTLVAAGSLFIFVASRNLTWLLVAACGIFIYADARANGIRKRADKNDLLNMGPLGWSLLAILFAIVGLPVYFLSRGSRRTRTGTSAFFALALVSAGLLAVLTVVTVLGAFPGSHSSSAGFTLPFIPDSRVERVRSGNLRSCPTRTLGQMADAFMESPKWEAGSSNDGTDFVNVSGGISYSEKPVSALVQFKIDKVSDSFEFQALEFNGVPQSKLLAIGLLTKMCREAGGTPQ